MVKAVLGSMERPPPSGVEGGVNSIEFIWTLDRPSGSVPEGSRHPITVVGGGHEEALPVDVCAQLPGLRKLLAGIPPRDLVELAVFAAVDGALEARSGSGGVGTLYLIPSGASQTVSGTFISKGQALWLTEEKIQAVGVSSQPLAAVLRRLRDLLDVIVHSCGGGGGEIDVKLHVKLVHSACAVDVCSPPGSEAPLPPTPCSGTDPCPSDFGLHQVRGRSGSGVGEQRFITFTFV